MGDNKAHQEEEVEAVKSIYNEECEILATKPFHQLRIRVSGQSSDATVWCYIKFEFNEDYPLSAPPQWRIEDAENLEDSEIADLSTVVEQTLADNSGCVAVFAVVANIQEHLVTLAENVAKRAEAERDRKIREAEEADKKRFEGTAVTVESFAVWRKQFYDEMAELEKREAAKAALNAGPKRLTGRELFSRDATLVSSDEAMRDSDDVVVDESLFNELDELDLGDEEAEEDDNTPLRFSDSEDDG